MYWKIYFGILLCVTKSFSTDSVIEHMFIYESEESSSVTNMEVTEIENTEEIFKNYCLPKNNTSGIVRVEICLYGLKSILSQKKPAYNISNIKYIIEKLWNFDGNEIINLNIFRQILNNQYYPIPKIVLPKFQSLEGIFKVYDPDKIGCISNGCFKLTLQQVIRNNDIVDHLMKPFSSDTVCYEEWLLKKRKDLYNNQEAWNISNKTHYG
ncbi:uncharacterized protein LOC126908309 [Daktulosphaira vitifoliae]|uniref:uncharacterized protein LOC126908309 n=1 Tax=Daktulosphaira vitifoliae TaxID=58002 RepID=UPI0021AA69EB|nr:uncharacterized protein LOC126908309 [Daktulosphaira vitifoliae]